jgi:hypothetical protein
MSIANRPHYLDTSQRDRSEDHPAWDYRGISQSEDGVIGSGLSALVAVQYTGGSTAFPTDEDQN